MTERDERMEFESFPERDDIQISKVMTTEGGREFRAVVTTGGTAVLTGVGELSNDIVIVQGIDPGDDENAVVYNKLWDALASIAESVGKGVGGLLGGIFGGDDGCDYESTTTVETDNKTGKTTVTTKMVCK